MSKTSQAVLKDEVITPKQPSEENDKQLLKKEMESQIRTRLDEFARELAEARKERNSKH